MKDIKILGPGCPKCTQLYKNAEEAAQGMGIDYEIEKVTDMLKMSEYGVMITPALVVDGEVRSVGKLLAPEDVAKFLK